MTIDKTILILGADGYLGWPTAMHFAKLGYKVIAVDNFAKRQWELEGGIEPLFPVSTLHKRVSLFKEITGYKITLEIGDLCNHRFVFKLFENYKPDVVIHYAEQPSAPYSMKDRSSAYYTQHNNVLGNLNVLFAMRHMHNDCHLIKLGSMGEYGTPNIDIEEGYLEIEHKGRKDLLPFPMQTNSFYHLSKVHDSNNIRFATKLWGLRTTDLNQGVVYGVSTPETELHPQLATSFHYDEVFGTALNRFCTQAVVGHPLTLYGLGKQTKAMLNIVDTLQCVQLAVENPAEVGFMRVFNQFTESFTLTELAQTIKDEAEKMGYEPTIAYVDNPRTEDEDHYYNPVSTGLPELGLKPTLLAGDVLSNMLRKIDEHKDRVDTSVIRMNVKWKND